MHAIRLDETLAEAHLNLGVTLRSEGKDAEAIASMRRAIERRPAYGEAHYNLGNALQAAGDLPGAIATFRRAVALEPKLAAPHFNLGIALLKTGTAADAATAFREALRLRPDFAEAEFNLGNALPGARRCGRGRRQLRARVEPHARLGRRLLQSRHRAATSGTNSRRPARPMPQPCSPTRLCFPRIVNSLTADATGELWLDFEALRSLTEPA